MVSTKTQTEQRCAASDVRVANASIIGVREHDVASPVESEIDACERALNSVLDAYRGLDRTRRVGEVQQVLYDDMTHFVNLRLETVSSVALLARSERVSDALGLCRSLLEHLLLLRLMTRGRRYIQVNAPITEGLAAAKRTLKEAKETLARDHARGEHEDIVDVRLFPGGKYPRIMWVRDGLTNQEEPDFYVSIHYFLFKEFKPENHRLDDERGIALWLPKNDPRRKKLRQSQLNRQQQQRDRYEQFLSWAALLNSLDVNGLMTKRQRRLMEGQYTFLGRFLHPTSGAALDLHDPPNFHDSSPGVGLRQPYDRRAVLLAMLYAAWIAADLADEIADMLESAPSRYIADPGTDELRAANAVVRKRFGYFWFLQDDPPWWDRYEYAMREATDAELNTPGGWPNIATTDVHCEWNAYERLKKALQTHHNARVGTYPSPLSSLGSPFFDPHLDIS